MAETKADVRLSVAQHLDLLNNAALKKIVRMLELSPGPNGPGGAPPPGQLLAAAIGSRQHREALERNFSAEDWALLNLLPLGLGVFRPRLLLLYLWNQGVRYEAAFAQVAKLLSFGCLLPVTPQANHTKLGIEANAIRDWGMSAWFELAPYVAGWAQEHADRAPALQPVQPPATLVAPAFTGLQRAAFLLLSEIGQRPLRLTQQGTPNKTDLRKLAAALEPRAKQKSISGPIPHLVYFTITVLLGADLLRAEERQLRPAAGVASFFVAPLADQAAQLYRGWLASLYDEFDSIPTLRTRFWDDSDTPWAVQESYGAPSSGQLKAARKAIELALKRLLVEAPEAWFPSDGLSTYLYQQFPEMLFARLAEYELFTTLGGFQKGQFSLHRAYNGVQRALRDGITSGPRAPDQGTLYQDTDWLEVEGAYVRQVLSEPLHWLGLVDVGSSQASGRDPPDRFRLTDLGQSILLGKEMAPAAPAPSGKAAIVQPSFEVVVVDAAANFGLLTQLDAFAERRNLDRAATYRLTQAALVRGLDQGWTGQGVLEALEAANGGPLPQNVRYSLEEWIHLYERLTLHPAAAMLETDDAAQLDRLLADPALAARFGARLGPTTILVPAEQARAIAKYLARQPGEIQTIDYAEPAAGLVQVREPDRIVLQAGAEEPYLCYRLQAFCTRVVRKAGQDIYQIAQQSVASAAAAGWDGARLAEFLSRYTGGPLPDEFLVRLLGWSGALPPLPAERLLALRLPAGAVTWAMLRAIPSIGWLIRALVGPEVALVAEADLPALREALNTRGLTLAEATIPSELFASEMPPADLRGVLAEYKKEPETIREALKSLGLLGKIEPPRRGWYY